MYGREIRIINRWEATSQTCCVCGFKGGKKELSVREWTCLNCGTTHDRDLNASANILKVAGGQSDTVNTRINRSDMDTFLICGLGSLGQHCVLALKEFGVKIVVIEQFQPLSWEIPQIPQLIDQLILADCRQISILQQADIEHCRAALLVTTSEQVNVETALAIRQLNPKTRLIMRSAKENLNELLQESLGNFIAYEPTQLPAAAFALGALGTETKGIFTLDGQRFQVIQRSILTGDRWCNQVLHELQSRTRRLLTVETPCERGITDFFQWKPNAALQGGDKITYIELANSFKVHSLHRESQTPTEKIPLKQRFQQIKTRLKEIWQRNVQQQGRRVVVICGLTVLILWLIGTILILLTYKGQTTPLSAFLATAILLLGGYADLFGELGQIDDIPSWLQLFSLGMTLAGTAFVGVLYALLTENLLSAKFSFNLNRPSIPNENHVIIVGLGRVGQRIATLLHEFKQTLVGITFKAEIDQDFLPEMSLIVGNIQESLTKVNLSTAKSVVVVTDDEILNLEVALMTQKLNPQSHLVIRTVGIGLGQQMQKLLPNAQIFGAYSVAAEVFAGAAFGENILTLFRLGNQTILVTEYNIEAEDTLNGLLLSEIAYGYRVIPILHQKPPATSHFMPSDDLQLYIGDRLVILATIDALRRIEQGDLNLSDKSYYLYVEKVFNENSLFEGANVIARISGCSLNQARTFMEKLPNVLETPLYKHQGLRLVRALAKISIKARLSSSNEL